MSRGASDLHLLYACSTHVTMDTECTCHCYVPPIACSSLADHPEQRGADKRAEAPFARLFQELSLTPVELSSDSDEEPDYVNLGTPTTGRPHPAGARRGGGQRGAARGPEARDGGSSEGFDGTDTCTAGTPTLAPASTTTTPATAAVQFSCDLITCELCGSSCGSTCGLSGDDPVYGNACTGGGRLPGAGGERVTPRWAPHLRAPGSVSVTPLMSAPLTPAPLTTTPLSILTSGAKLRSLRGKRRTPIVVQRGRGRSALTPMDIPQEPMDTPTRPMDTRQESLDTPTRPGTMDTRHGPMDTKQGPMTTQFGHMDTHQGIMDTRHGHMDTRHGPMDTRHGPIDARQGPMDTRKGPMDTRPRPMDTRQGPMDIVRFQTPQSGRSDAARPTDPRHPTPGAACPKGLRHPDLGAEAGPTPAPAPPSALAPAPAPAHTLGEHSAITSIKRSCMAALTMSKSMDELDTIREEAVPELYSFEDYASSLDPFEPLDDLPDTYVCLHSRPLGAERAHTPLAATRSLGDVPFCNGREFARAKTAPCIPVCEVLGGSEAVRQAYRTPPRRPPPALHSRSARPATRPPQDDECQDPEAVPPIPTMRDYRRYRPPLLRSGTAWLLGGDDEDSYLGSVPPPGVPSPGDGNMLSPNSIPQLYYTTPPRAQMASSPTTEDKSRLERAGSGKSGLARIARRLSHKERRNTEERRRALRQRSISLDCGDGRRALMSSNLEPPAQDDPNSLSIPASPSLPTRLSKNSSSPNLTGRLSRRASATGNKNRKSERDGDTSRDKRKKNMADVQALFDAVELQDMDRAREILDNNLLDVNSVDEDECTVLDIAILTNHVPMAKMLLAFGARENPKYQRLPSQRLTQLEVLVVEAERRATELRALVGEAAAGATTSASIVKDIERQLNFYDFRCKLLKRMRSGYEHAELPSEPTSVALNIVSSSSLLVTFDEPLQHNGAVVTRYKVEWSCYEDFTPLAGEQIIEDPHFTYYEIPELVPGNVYYARVCAWNIRGFGPPAGSTPHSAVPSCWREVDDVKPRTDGKLQLINNLFVNIRNSRPADAIEIKDTQTPGSSPLHPRKSTMRKSIKNLFSSAPKFQKVLKRGVYLGCVICHEDRVLVTAEENLPILEVDENFSTTSLSLNTDFHWIMKVACTWEDVKSLRQDMDKSSSSGSVQFRSKLLQAAAQLQSAMGVQDLGQLYHQPVRDISGSIILVTINILRDPKGVNTTHAKWASLNKLQRRLPSADALPASEMLLNLASEMLCYQAASTRPLSRGLYLGYLKLKSSVDQIRIMVPESSPNVIPHVKVRGYPNVTKEEWQWLSHLSQNEVAQPPTPAQITFQSAVTAACKKLLMQLGVTEDDSVSHRLYDLEVIEVNEDVAFLLVLPPVESVCSVPGHQEQITQRPRHLTLPVQVFEMTHMSTYQRAFIQRYTRLSSILEMDCHLAQQAQREAFSSEELSAARERVERLTALQQQLDEAWRGMRWTMDIITYARDKSVRGGLPLGVLYAPPPSPSESPVFERRTDIEKCTSSSSSDVASSTCSDCGYHSDISSMEGGTGEAGHQCRGPVSSASDSQCTCPTGEGVGDTEEVWTRSTPVCAQPGVLRVYSAYETGLAKGTSVKLHVTPRTTSHEVIHLVVQQLNRAALSKGHTGPVYTEEELEDFCLVAVIGARERVLRDDYQPLQLQNPWTKGKLFVRLKHCVLAALEQGQVTTV